ncbi:toxin-antitoxin system YwqK family antitoxin [Humidisolicoccus flavus]|uniref:toxin-antitoxin system YwqK family antitoxin n=1 Tax=Humidisolicoccus flavus TaxID=3111414 RepID=UPI00324F28AC
MAGASADDAQEPVPFEKFHRDGSLWARGQHLGGTEHGYWEWFRLDGTIMRSGTFDHGAQVGEWTTYDKQGAVYKVTDKGDASS